jgi:hypothetical protein
MKFPSMSALLEVRRVLALAARGNDSIAFHTADISRE